MEGYAENGAGTDVTDQIGFGGMRRKRRKHRGLTVFQLKVIGAVALFSPPAAPPSFRCSSDRTSTT